MTFKDENLPLQVLAREHAKLRANNLRFRDGDPQHDMLMFAEAAVVCMALEHFVRIVLARDGVSAATIDGATLHNLLEMAIAKKLVTLPFADQGDGVRKVCAVRNTLLHGNYSQAAANAKCSSVLEYFKTQFSAEVEGMTRITDDLMKQIDPQTGKRYTPL